MDLKRNQYINVIACAGAILSLIPSANTRAEFVLDWNADNTSQTFSGSSIIHGDSTITGQTPFVFERVTDPGTGTNYYHLIVGDPAQDFAQEVYIQQGGVSFQGFGNIRQGSASGGRGDTTGNGSDPLGVVNGKLFTGNGTGNPQRIQMREVINDGDFSMDFLKNVFLEKPIISLEITGTDMQSQVIIDGRGIGYDDDTTSAVVTNTMQITDPNIPEASASFDMATDSQDSNVTAGRYIYTPSGSGANGGGTYTYTDDTFNVDNINWADYFDSSLPNPWSYTANRP